MICPDFDQLFYPILNAVRISPDFDQLSNKTTTSVKDGQWTEIIIFKKNEFYYCCKYCIYCRERCIDQKKPKRQRISKRMINNVTSYL